MSGGGSCGGGGGISAGIGPLVGGQMDSLLPGQRR